MSRSLRTMTLGLVLLSGFAAVADNAFLPLVGNYIGPNYSCSDEDDNAYNVCRFELCVRVSEDGKSASVKVWSGKDYKPFFFQNEVKLQEGLHDNLFGQFVPVKNGVGFEYKDQSTDYYQTDRSYSLTNVNGKLNYKVRSVQMYERKETKSDKIETDIDFKPAPATMRKQFVENCDPLPPDIRDTERKVDAKGIIRDGFGLPIRVRYVEQAKAACSEQGMKLPTIRELIKVAKPSGISEVVKAGAQTPAGYTFVATNDRVPWTKGCISFDCFNYNPSGYRPIEDIELAPGFWSSSMKYDSTWPTVYVLLGKKGRISTDFDNLSGPLAVRCVPQK